MRRFCSRLIASCTLAMCHALPCFATLASETGELNFDTSSDGNHEMRLNATGLAIGTNLSPSANLHVAGNVIISDTVLIGAQHSTNNTLHVHGTISYEPQKVSSGNHTVESSIVFADTSSGNIVLSLPPVSSSLGMVVTIKRTSLNHNVYLTTAGSNIGEMTTAVLGQGTMQSIRLMNSGSSWLVLDNTESSALNEVASSNLFLWWALNETSGNSISDSSLNNRTGTLNNDHLFSGNSVSGPLSNALLLSSRHMEALYNDDPLPTASYTYALWSQYNVDSDASLDFETSIDGSAGFVWCSDNATFHRSAFHQLTDNSYVTTALSSTLSANVWHHIAVSWSGNDLSLYLNGEFQSGKPAASWIGASNLILTNPATHDGGESRVDDLRFYNKALTSDEIRALYLAGQP